MPNKDDILFKCFCNQKCKIEKTLKYFPISFKKVNNFDKFYLFSETHKFLFNLPETPVNSNFGVPTNKASEFFDSYLKLLMQNS